ncbi:HEAT repeat domain-containing protein [Spirochaetota bacterium]
MNNKLKKISKWKKNGKIDELINALKDKNSQIRLAAANALDTINWKPSRKDKAYYHVAKQDWDKCVDLGKISVDPLLNTLNETDKSLFASITKSLGRIKDDRTIEPLVDKIRTEKSIYLFKAVALTLLGFAGTKVIKPFTNLLDHFLSSTEVLIIRKKKDIINAFALIERSEIIIDILKKFDTPHSNNIVQKGKKIIKNKLKEIENKKTTGIITLLFYFIQFYW